MMKRKPRKLTLPEVFEHHQLTRVLRHWLQKAVEQNEPVAALHESLQPIEDSKEFQDFDWTIIETALDDVLCDRQTLQGAASKAALEITGLSVTQRL
jgi:hypothetical protein